MQDLTLAVIAMTSSSDKAKNLETAFNFVREAKAQGADWVQLPEMWSFMGTYDLVYEMAEVDGGELFQALSALAKELKIVLFAGTVGERPGPGLTKSEMSNDQGQLRVYNTSYVFGRDGGIIAKYRKTHLFNLKRDDGPSYCESDGFIPGAQAVTFTTEGFKLGLTICYDLRFPELYARLGRAGSPDVLAIPSAFTKGTGLAHWELLLRARAVENQCYVYAANQVGTHSPGKESFGHGMIIDPWGDVLASTGDKPGIALAKISRTKLTEVRGKLPALANRRPSLY